MGATPRIIATWPPNNPRARRYGGKKGMETP
jgi:hypothetical protein